jgi:hypothetical protein
MDVPSTRKVFLPSSCVADIFSSLITFQFLVPGC